MPCAWRARNLHRRFAIPSLLDRLTRNAFNADILVAQTLVTAHLHHAPLERQDIVHLARYCHMLAGRFPLSPIQTARFVLAAWLSFSDDQPQQAAVMLRDRHRLCNIFRHLHPTHLNR